MRVTHINTNRLRGKWHKVLRKSKDGAIILVGRKQILFSWDEFKDMFERNPENAREVKFKEVKLSKMEQANRLLTSLAMMCKLINLTDGKQLHMYLALNDDFKRLKELTEVSELELVDSIVDEIKYLEKKTEANLLGIKLGKPKPVPVNDSLSRYDIQNTKNGKEMGMSGFSIKNIIEK